MTTQTQSQGGDGKGNDGKGADDLDERIAKALAAALATALPAAIKAALPKKGKLQPQPPPKAPEEDDDDDDDELPAAAVPPTKAKSNSRVRQLSKKLAILEEERKAEKHAARTRAAYDRVQAELTGKVRPEHLTPALTMLRGMNVIAVDEDGEARYRDGDEELTLGEGVQRFLKSPAGALFAPGKSTAAKPPTVSSFTTPTNTQQQGITQPITDANRASVLAGALGLLH